MCHVKQMYCQRVIVRVSIIIISCNMKREYKNPSRLDGVATPPRRRMRQPAIGKSQTASNKASNYNLQVTFYLLI